MKIFIIFLSLLKALHASFIFTDTLDIEDKKITFYSIDAKNKTHQEPKGGFDIIHQNLQKIQPGNPGESNFITASVSLLFSNTDNIYNFNLPIMESKKFVLYESGFSKRTDFNNNQHYSFGQSSEVGEFLWTAI